MNIKLLVTDIDDTLVYKSGPVSEENLRAIRAAREAGIYVTLATGRGYFGASRVVKQLGLDTFVINYGGAVIMDASTDKPIFTTELENSYVHEILGMANEMDLHAHLYQGDCIVYEKPHKYASNYVAALNLPSRIDPDIRKKVWSAVPKVLIITEPERVPELLPFFQKHFEGRVAVSGSSPGFIEFNRLGQNKGTAVAQLAKMLGIERENVAAIGDNTLDYEMIEYAGVGVVVENGNEKLKAIADVIVPPCTENGVAYFINNYLLNDRETVERGENNMYSIGFDIGGTNVVCALMDDGYRIIKKLSRPFRKNDSGSEAGDESFIANELKTLAEGVCRESNVPLEDVPSVGVCIPGSVDTERGIVIDAYNLGLHDSHFRDAACKAMNKPVSLLNDADAAALAEQRLGALAETKTSMLVTIGTGIGVGIVLDGKLFHGGRGNGVEAGHVQMDLHGEHCTCGRRGCIETLCSATRLNREAAKLFESAEGETKAYYEKLAASNKFDAKALIDAAKQGDPACGAIWTQYLSDLANALGSYINILDPEMIAIGGGVSGAGDFLTEPLIELTAKQSFFRTPTPIVCAKLGNDAGLVGAALYGRETL
ncbi:MAG: ROK family protein [Clostridia bacterium]|nr:ROK family protein [Clostridia bacterium]